MTTNGRERTYAEALVELIERFDAWVQQVDDVVVERVLELLGEDPKRDLINAIEQALDEADADAQAALFDGLDEADP